MLNGRRHGFPLGNICTTMYDQLGRVTSYTYDAANNRSTRTDARGILTTYSYDGANQLIGRQYPHDPSVTFGYDADGNCALMLDASGTTTYAYDHADRLNVVTNGYGQSVSYSYSGINQRLTLQDPSLATFSYTYDAARRLSTVVNPQNSRTTFSYDLADRRMLAHNGNGTSTSYVYDAADRLLWLNHFGPGSAGIAGFTYTYDNVGNPQSVLELDGSTVDWTNDGANQLILEDRTGTDAAHRKNYYDGRGNRFEQDLNSGLTKVNGFSYDNADQLKVLTSYNLSAIATLTSYTYDPAGNLLGVLNPPGTQPTTFVWDDEGRNKLVQLPTGVSVTSTFNGDNLRMQRVDNSGTVRYVWDGQAYLAETDGSNVMQAEYTQEPAQYGGLLSQYRLTGGVWTPSYYHFDRIGSTRALTSSSGSITDTYFYEAFGTSLGGTGSTVNPFQFIGQLGYYRDAASGLYYVRQRVYDPVTGRWVSVDPIQFRSGGSNPYRYVGNRPVLDVDPRGLAVLRFMPTTTLNMPWQDSSSVVYGETSGKIDVFCTCIPLCYRRRIFYRISAAVQANFKIVLDPGMISRDPDGLGLDLREVYGHEQRHVESFRFYAQSVRDKLMIAERLYSFQTKNACDAYATQLEQFYGAATERYAEADRMHENPRSPRSATGYEPLGGQMPAGTPEQAVPLGPDPFQPYRPETGAPTTESI